MTNRIAAVLGLFLLGLLLADVLIFGSEHIVFLAKKLLDLIDWMAFWR
jgi:hypothetical protein